MRWTTKTAVTDNILIEALEAIHKLSHDEYGWKTGGLVQSLERQSALFGLRFSQLYALQLNKCTKLSGEGHSRIQYIYPIEIAQTHYSRLRSGKSSSNSMVGQFKMPHNQCML